MKIQPTCCCGIRNCFHVVSMVVHAVDGVRVCEKYFHLGEGLFCFTIGAILELITLDTCALKGSVQIFALLVAEIPFFAFISIYKKLINRVIFNTVKICIPIQALESFPTFLPTGQVQVPPSSELRHSNSHPREEQRLLAEMRWYCNMCPNLDV